MIEPERIVKGAYFPAEEIDAIFGINPDDPMRSLILLGIRSRIEDDYEVVVRMNQGGLRILQDNEVPTYVVSRANQADRIVKRNVDRIATVDASELTANELRGLESARSIAAAHFFDLERRRKNEERFG